MATSGTVTYSVTEQAIYEDALADIGVMDAGMGSVPPEYVPLCRRKLNMLVKQWVSQADFAPGLKMWTRRRAYLFLQADQVEYDLGPGGDPTSEGDYVTTTLTAASPASDTTLTVSSITGIATTNPIGIVLDDGSIHWTTVNGAPAGNTVTITAAVPTDAAIGRRVFVYTSLMRRPFEIVSAVLRDEDGNDVPIDPAISVEEYESIPVKMSAGSPYQMYIEPRRTTTKAFLDCAPDDVSKVIRLVYLSYIEDLTGLADEVDFPAEWFRPLAAQLAVDLCPAFGRPVTPDLKLKRDEALAIAKNAHPATSNAYFASCPDEY
jgi:hypothetical protein